MVTIPNTLKNKANEKVRKFLRKYSLLLKKLHPNLAASHRKEEVQIEGNWVKQFRLVLEQYVRDQEAENWQDFIQLVIDLKFHDLYKQIEKAELLCYKEEIKPPKIKKVLFNELTEPFSVLATRYLRCLSLEERDKVREEMYKALFLTFQGLKTIREIKGTLKEFSDLANLELTVLRVSKMASRNSEELIYFIRNEIKRISKSASPVQTSVPPNPAQNQRFKPLSPRPADFNTNGLDNYIASRRKDVTTEPTRRSPGLHEQINNERTVYAVPSPDSTVDFSSEEPIIRAVDPRPERDRWARFAREYSVRVQNAQSLPREGYVVDGLESSEGVPQEAED